MAMFGPERQGTIRGIEAEVFSPEADAAFIKDCMDGMGTEDTQLMTIITDRTNEQRLAIAEAYEGQYGDSLVDRIKSETSGKYEKTLVALMTPTALFDAQQIREAVAGFGTNETLLNEIICTRTGQELSEICQAYEARYGEELKSRIKGESSGDYERYLVACLEQRPEEKSPEGVDDAEVNSKAEALYNAGEARWGTNESVFVDVLAGSSFAQLRKIALAYQEKSQKTLLQVCIDELGGHFEDAVKVTIEHATRPDKLWGEKIHKTMKGLGTNDSRLIQLMVSRSERDLLTIRNQFGIEEIGDGKSLHGWIESDTSGNFEKVLLSILNAADREPILVGVQDDGDDEKEDNGDEEATEPVEPIEDDQPVESGVIGTLRVALKSHHGLYLSAQPDTRLEWNRDAVGDWERFELEEREDNKIALRSCHGLYVCADNGGAFVADRELAGEWEMFDLEMSEGLFTLRTAHGFFVSVQPDGRAETNREEVGDWERLRLVVLMDASDGATINLRSCHGQLMSAQEDGTVEWNRDEVGPWEIFTIVPQEDGGVAFRTVHGTYVCAEEDGQLVSNREEIGPWETFQVEYFDNEFSLRTAHGLYVSAQEDGSVQINREEVGPWELFKFR